MCTYITAGTAWDDMISQEMAVEAESEDIDLGGDLCQISGF